MRFRTQLASLVAVKHETTRITAFAQRMLQRRKDKFCVGFGRHCRIHHASCMEIHNGSQIMPTFTCPDVRDVTTPDLIGLCHIELPVQLVRDIQPCLTRPHVTMTTWLARDEIGLSHEPAHFETANRISMIEHHSSRGGQEQ